jgi:hypothetical protein
MLISIAKSLINPAVLEDAEQFYEQRSWKFVKTLVYSIDWEKQLWLDCERPVDWG